MSEYFNDEWGEIYILKPPLVLVVKAMIGVDYNGFNQLENDI